MIFARLPRTGGACCTLSGCAAHCAHRDNDALTRRNPRPAPLRDAREFVSSFDRPNIRYLITERVDERAQLPPSARTCRRVRHCHCLSRKKVDATADWLNAEMTRALPYRWHGSGGAPAQPVALPARGGHRDGGNHRVWHGHRQNPMACAWRISICPRASRATTRRPARRPRRRRVRGADDLRSRRRRATATLHRAERGKREFKRAGRAKLDALLGLARRRPAAEDGCWRTSVNAAGRLRLRQLRHLLNPPQTWDATELVRMALSAIYRTRPALWRHLCHRSAHGQDDDPDARPWPRHLAGARHRQGTTKQRGAMCSGRS